MAQLDIERKSGGTSWIWWLVGLVVLALIVWWMVAATTGHENVAGGEVGTMPAVAAPVAPADVGGYDASGVVTDLGMLTDTSAAGVIGRHVALVSVPVLRAVSDRGFWAGTGEAPSNGVFIVRGNQSADATAPNGAVDAGAMVNVWGTVERMPGNLTQQASDWNLQSTDQARLGEQRVYIQADSVRIAAS
jgi:hypothetical protein